MERSHGEMVEMGIDKGKQERLGTWVRWVSSGRAKKESILDMLFTSNDRKQYCQHVIHLK